MIKTLSLAAAMTAAVLAHPSNVIKHDPKTVRADLPVTQKDRASNRTWISRSDAYSQQLIDIDFKYNPELGTQQGLALYDTQVSVPTQANVRNERRADEAMLLQLEAGLKTEKNEKVSRDLKIMIDVLKLRFRRWDYDNAHRVNVYNPSSFIFDGLYIFLDDQVKPERRTAAVARLRKYAGVEKGCEPLTQVYIARIKEQLSKPGISYPARVRIEKDLLNGAGIIANLPELFTKYKIAGWEAPYAALKKQVNDYDQWVRDNVLPKAGTDYKLPAEEYAINLAEFGVDIAPAELAKTATAAFTEIQEQMKPIAAQIAKERGFPSADYRDVIRELKKQQLAGAAIMELYQKNLTTVEAIISKHGIITLPVRPAVMRLSSAAEAAQLASPHLVSAPFLNNTGEKGAFVLPLDLPTSADGKGGAKYDDFTSASASWPTIAHEVRPGHELQFDKIIENGMSKARGYYAVNGATEEGWALYAEYLIQPYMPLEGQLITLDFRLQRAARAFLDPGLQSGKYTPQQALEILMNDVVFSRGYAQQEVNRYTVIWPGQANCYFYGFIRILALRKETEQLLGSKFNEQRFHDFIIAQGSLSVAVIRDAVIRHFIPSEKKKS